MAKYTITQKSGSATYTLSTGARGPKGDAGASTAADVSFSPTGNIAATNVQAALAELDSEKAAVGDIPTVDNTTVNAAIAEDPAATRDVLGIPLVNVLDYGVVADAKVASDCSISASSSTLTSAAHAQFAAGDVGKYIRVTGAGAAGADLITTIATRISATQVTLTDAAGATVSTAHVVFGTDNTTNMQAAVDAARITTGQNKIIYIPSGLYLCNITIYDHTRIEGDGAGGNNILTGGNYTTKYGTVLIPADTSTPVIYADSAQNSVLRKFEVASARPSGDFSLGGDRATNNPLALPYQGYGICLGDHAYAATGFAVQGMLAENINIVGFKYGFAMSRSADSIIQNFNMAWCEYGLYLGSLPDGGGTHKPCDTQKVITCASNFCDYPIFVGAAKGMMIYGCATNTPVTFLWAKGNSKVTLDGANIEQPLGDEIVLEDSANLTVGTLQRIGGSGAPIANKGTGLVSILGGGLVGPSYIKVVGTNTPVVAPHRTFIHRYTDSTWANKLDEEPFELYNRRVPNMTGATGPLYLDEGWSRDVGGLVIYDGTGTSTAVKTVYGNLGWVKTTISGTVTMSVYQSLPRINSASGTTHSARFSLDATCLWLTDALEMRFVFSDSYAASSSAGTYFRVGNYSYDASMTPVDGYGFKADGTVSANLRFEVINNSSVVADIDTGIALNTLANPHELIIRRTDNTLYGAVKNSSGYTGTLAKTTASLRSVYSGPAIYAGASSARSLGYRPHRFTYRKLSQ